MSKSLSYVAELFPPGRYFIGDLCYIDADAGFTWEEGSPDHAGTDNDFGM